MSMATVRVTVGTGRTFYVAPGGSNSNPGTQSQPFRNISHVINAAFGLQPGDTVIVMPGTYTEQIWASEGGDGSGPVSWDEPTSVGSGYVTIRSQVRHQALLRPPSGAYSTFNIDSNYFCIAGFDVVGGGGHGIQCDGSHHHIKIIDNVCHDSGGSGISTANNGAEFLLVEGNVCHGNANRNGFHCSGISVFGPSNSSGDTTAPGFRIIVRNNICYNNIEIDTGGEHTDGNGIILDFFEINSYTYPSLVEGNLCFNNGGKGIQVYHSSNVLIRNNTCYRNNVDMANPGTWRGELSNAVCDSNTWVNNIAVCDPTINSNNRAINDTDTQGGNVNVRWHNNLTFNGTAGQSSILAVGSNTSLTANAPYNNILGANPLFIAPGMTASSNFRLQSGSPALNVGTSAFGVAAIDLDGSPRVFGVTVDLGCYERQD